MNKLKFLPIAIAIAALFALSNTVKADELLNLLKAYNTFTPVASSAPGYYDSTLVANYNSLVKTAKSAKGLAVRDSIAVLLKAAYEDVKAKGYNEIKPGYYYLTSAFAKYKTKYGQPAAMYPDASSGLMKYKKFVNEDKEFIYKLTPGTDGWYCQNAATGAYIGTGNGDKWYSEFITWTEEQVNEQLFTWMAEGQFFVADDVDRLTSRCIYSASSVNETGSIYNWSTTSDPIVEEISGYNFWNLTPVPQATLNKLGLTDVIVVPEDTMVNINAHWMSLGTSITWYNDNVSSAFTKGYQTRVREVLPFKRFTNKGVNGGVLATAIPQVSHADYYTIEHGINDWGHSTPVGTIDDYINNTNNGTFAANYRLLIDAIYKANPKAMIVLCTPRKGYGFGTYLPSDCNLPLNNIYLHEYADIVRQIADYESLPVADFYAYCGNQHNLHLLSIDKALHPNDNGYQLMADVLVKAMKKILIHPIIDPTETPKE